MKKRKGIKGRKQKTKQIKIQGHMLKPMPGQSRSGLKYFLCSSDRLPNRQLLEHFNPHLLSLDYLHTYSGGHFDIYWGGSESIIGRRETIKESNSIYFGLALLVEGEHPLHPLGSATAYVYLFVCMQLDKNNRNEIGFYPLK